MTFFRTILYILTCLSLILPNAWSHHPGHVPVELNEGGAEGISSASLVNSPTAGTLGRNRVLAGFLFDYFRYNSIPARNAHELHEEGRDVHGKNHEQFYDMALGFGVLEDLDFYLTEPVVSKNSIEVHEHDMLGRKERASGFGDLRFGTKYRFWKQYVEATVLAGIKFPTGRTTAKRKSGDKFAPELQPGTGSWDGEFGLAVSRSFKHHFSAASSFQYVLRSEGAQDFKQGDSFRYNVGSSVSLREIGKYPNLSFSTELNNEWALRDHSREEDRGLDSGGTTIFLTPGATANVTKNLSVFFGIPIPIYQNLGGEHEELKFGLIAGAAISV